MEPAGRQFVAIPVPQERALHERVEALRGAWPEGAAAPRWSAVGRMHLTLRFFGELDLACKRALDASLATLEVPGLRLELHGGLGVFPDPRRATVLWASVGGEVRGLRELAARIEACARAAGCRPERKPFRPHVTLGRWRRPPPEAALRPWLERVRFGGRAFGWSAGEVGRYASVLRPEGAVYTELARYGS